MVGQNITVPTVSGTEWLGKHYGVGTSVVIESSTALIVARYGVITPNVTALTVINYDFGMVNITNYANSC